MPRWPKLSMSERFWSHVDISDDCWTWGLSLDDAGYGKFHPSSQTVCKAHRFAYEDVVGPIPDGLVIDHLCHNRACVNPDHLEPVTQHENMRRAAPTAVNIIAKAITHCPSGHAYSADNTYVHRGKRYCRACGRAAAARLRRERRAAS